MSRPERYPRITDKKVYDARFDEIAWPSRQRKRQASGAGLKSLGRSRLSKQDRESVLANGLRPS